MKWKVQVRSHRFIPYPAENFLKVMKEDRGNIIFIPPDYIPTQNCQVQMYTVSSCNESGLWDYYEERIEKACESFIDPFNLTYKNIFCYLCNIGNNTLTVNMSCPELTPKMGKNDITPPFFGILDISIAKGETVGEDMRCERSQFVDKVTVR